MKRMKRWTMAALVAAVALAITPRGAEAQNSEPQCQVVRVGFDGQTHGSFLNGVLGGLDFGTGNFAAWDNSNSGTINPIWTACGIDTRNIFIPGNSADPPSETLVEETRIIEFVDGNCLLLNITVATHGDEVGRMRIRSLDADMNPTGDVFIWYLVPGVCEVELITNFTIPAAKLEITYSRGSEMGIFELIYCCPEPSDPNFAGCTPGFWKNHTDVWPTTDGINGPGTDVEDFFGLVDGSANNRTFGLTLNLRGRANKIPFLKLLKHAVAAVLNAASADVNYEFTVAEIIAAVQTAIAGGDNAMLAQKDIFDTANNRGCTIDAKGNPIDR